LISKRVENLHVDGLFALTVFQKEVE
jgi:hypothetical protein